MTAPARPELGVTDSKVAFDDSERLHDLALHMAGQCQRTLDIITRHLDPAIYDNDAFAEAIRQLAIRSRHSRIRIIITDPQAVAKHGHRLLDLAMQLPTFIALRKPGHEHAQFNEAWLIADKIGYIRRPFADRFTGTANFRDRRQAHDLTQGFDDIWVHAELDPNLRRLSL